jgi:hypothetical protein
MKAETAIDPMWWILIALVVGILLLMAFLSKVKGFGFL